MDKMAEQNFFLISFLPAIAYWYLESHYSVTIAAIGGVGLSIIGLMIEKIFIKTIHSISKLNLVLLVLLAALTIFAGNGIWFKLQPMFTGLFMGIYFLISQHRGKSIMLEMMNSMNKKIIFPEKYFLLIERDMAILLIGYGTFMGAVALRGTTSNWLFFKTIGFYIAFFIFLFFEFFKLKFVLKKEYLKK